MYFFKLAKISLLAYGKHYEINNTPLLEMALTNTPTMKATDLMAFNKARPGWQFFHLINPSISLDPGNLYIVYNAI